MSTPQIGVPARSRKRALSNAEVDGNHDTLDNYGSRQALRKARRLQQSSDTGKNKPHPVGRGPNPQNSKFVTAPTSIEPDCPGLRPHPQLEDGAQPQYMGLFFHREWPTLSGPIAAQLQDFKNVLTGLDQVPRKRKAQHPLDDNTVNKQGSKEALQDYVVPRRATMPVMDPADQSERIKKRRRLSTTTTTTPQSPLHNPASTPSTVSNRGAGGLSNHRRLPAARYPTGIGSEQPFTLQISSGAQDAPSPSVFQFPQPHPQSPLSSSSPAILPGLPSAHSANSQFEPLERLQTTLLAPKGGDWLVEREETTPVSSRASTPELRNPCSFPIEFAMERQAQQSVSNIGLHVGNNDITIGTDSEGPDESHYQNESEGETSGPGAIEPPSTVRLPTYAVADRRVRPRFSHFSIRTLIYGLLISFLLITTLFSTHRHSTEPRVRFKSLNWYRRYLDTIYLHVLIPRVLMFGFPDLKLPGDIAADDPSTGNFCPRMMAQVPNGSQHHTHEEVYNCLGTGYDERKEFFILNAEHHWRLQVDGERPEDPDPLFDYHADDRNSSWLPWPSCRPIWESSPSGNFVPEFFFLQDIKAVSREVCYGLRKVADHGPMTFLFTRGSSTQFRWSTSGYAFVGAHATPSAEAIVPGPDGAVDDGSPSSGEAVTWTRPIHALLVSNLDPPLVRSCERLFQSIDVVSLLRGSVDHSPDTRRTDTMLPLDIILHLFGRLSIKQATARQEWYQTHQKEFVEQDYETEYGRSMDFDFNAGTDIWRLIAEDPRFPAAVLEKKSDGDAEHSTHLPPRLADDPHDWNRAQLLNGTAQVLLEKIYRVVKRTAETYSVAKMDKAVAQLREVLFTGNISERGWNLEFKPQVLPDVYAEALAKLIGDVQDLASRVGQVRDELCSRPVEANMGVPEYIRGVCSAAPFIHQIVLPRLSYMHSNARKGVYLSRHLAAQLEELDREIQGFWDQQIATIAKGQQQERHWLGRCANWLHPRTPRWLWWESAGPWAGPSVVDPDRVGGGGTDGHVYQDDDAEVPGDESPRQSSPSHTLYYFPYMADLGFSLQAAREWIVLEVGELTGQKEAEWKAFENAVEEAEDRLRRERGSPVADTHRCEDGQHPPNFVSGPLWSRWSAADYREDPYGKDRICEAPQYNV